MIIKKKILLSKNETLLIYSLFLILYKLFLDINYIFIIAPRYYYVGFLNNTDTIKYVFGWGVFLAFVPIIITLFLKKSVLGYIGSLLGIMAVTPAISLASFLSMPPAMTYQYFIYWLLFYTSVFILDKKKLIYIKIYGNYRSAIKYYGILLTFLTILYISGRYTGFRIFTNIDDEYMLRLEARNFNIPTILNYLWGMSVTLLSIITVYFCYMKNRIGVCICVYLGILNFYIAGEKYSLIILFCALAIGIFYKNQDSLIMLGVTSIPVISFLEYGIIGSIHICANIVRRVFYIPSLLNYYYFDFFTTHTPDYYKQGFLRWVGFRSQYKTPIPRIIGATYIREGMNSNNGLFSEAVSNFGSMGCIVMPIILALLIKAIDYSSYKSHQKLKILFSVLSVFILISGNLTTALLTNGLLLGMLYIYNLNEDYYGKYGHTTINRSNRKNSMEY